MDATTAIAVYAAFVASAAALVQYLQWRSARTEVRVAVFGGTAPVPSPEAGTEFDEENERADVVFIHITNRSPHPVKVTHLWLGSVGRRNQKVRALERPFPLDTRFPAEIPARDNLMVWLRRSELQDEWEGRRWQVQVLTAGGDRFNSENVRLREIGTADLAI